MADNPPHFTPDDLRRYDRLTRASEALTNERHMALSHPAVTVARVGRHQLEAHCGCGAGWFLLVDGDPDELEVECLACGETVVDLRDLGAHHSAGADVEPT